LTLIFVDPRSEKVLWEKNLHDKKKDQQTDSLTMPPALVNGKAFVGTTRREVFCMDAANGKVLWSVNVGAPILFQPAVVKGRVYVSTNNGGMLCLETGDAKDDGWLIWGANAGHNVTVK